MESSSSSQASLISKKEKLLCCGGDQESRSGVQKWGGGCLNLPWVTFWFQLSSPYRWLAKCCVKMTLIQELPGWQAALSRGRGSLL